MDALHRGSVHAAYIGALRILLTIADEDDWLGYLANDPRNDDCGLDFGDILHLHPPRRSTSLDLRSGLSLCSSLFARSRSNLSILLAQPIATR